jgi:hypothetical protein
MKFMLMMSCTRADFESLSSWSQADFKAHVEFMIRLNEKLAAKGELVAAEGLDMPGNAKIVRARKGTAPLVTDGPFAETKEFLAGFWIVDVESRQRAVEIAGEASAAPGPGGEAMSIPIELRQVMSAPTFDA